MRTLATFRLGGDGGGTAAEVTRRLGITPSSAGEAGERRRPSVPPATVAHWSLSSAAGPEDDVELAPQLHRLLDVLEPVAGELARLVEEGWWANWSCYVGSNAGEHAVELDRPTLRRLLALPGDLWLDVYPDD